jgi:transposase
LAKADQFSTDVYPTDLRGKFIELRAQGFSLRNIAGQLGIDRNTAFDWSRKYKTEIQNLRAFELEAIQEQFLPSYAEEMALLGEELKRINTELRTRDYDYESTAFLANRQSTILARIDKKRVLPPVEAVSEDPEPPTEPKN